MSTRPLHDATATARAAWTADTRRLAQQVGTDLDREVDAHLLLGQEIAQARTTALLTQAELARQSGVQQADLSRIERGLGNPTRETLGKVAAALGQRLTLTPHG